MWREYGRGMSLAVAWPRQRGCRPRVRGWTRWTGDNMTTSRCWEEAHMKGLVLLLLAVASVPAESAASIDGGFDLEARIRAEFPEEAAGTGAVFGGAYAEFRRAFDLGKLVKAAEVRLDRGRPRASR